MLTLNEFLARVVMYITILFLLTRICIQLCSFAVKGIFKNKFFTCMETTQFPDTIKLDNNLFLRKNYTQNINATKIQN